MSAQGYSPAALVLQKGMKAAITFKVDALTSCNNPVSFPEYNGRIDLTQGKTRTPVITVREDFTFQCWMGMLRGYVKTVDDLSTVNPQGKRRAFTCHSRGMDIMNIEDPVVGSIRKQNTDGPDAMDLADGKSVDPELLS